MARGDRAYAGLVAAWVMVSLALPDWKLDFGLMGGSPGSRTSGLNLYFTELLAVPLFAWAFVFRRSMLPRWAWIFTGIWTLLLLGALVSGLRSGSHPRDTLAEARPILLGVDMLVLAALDQKGRAWALAAFFFGWLAWAGITLFRFVLDPLAASNPNIVPVPVPAVDHALHHLWLCAALGLVVSLRKGFSPMVAWAAVALAWVLVWLSYLRALWVAWPLALGLVGLWLLKGRQAKQALRWIGAQLLVMLATFAMLLLSLHFFAPDGEYLLQFRVYRTLQAMHLAPAMPERVEILGRQSASLKELAAKGGLFRNPEDNDRAPSAAAVAKADFSLSDRALMRQQAWAAFQASPWIGKGLGYVFHYELYPGAEISLRDPHNGYAWWIAKSGIAGVTVWVGILLWVLLAFLRQEVSVPVQAAQLGVVGLFLILEFFQVGLLNADVCLALAGVTILADREGR